MSKPSARVRAALARAKPYEDAAAALIASSGCTIRRYRPTLSGVAYTDSTDWGIEVPAPRGPVAFAIFAHEVAHQVFHRGSGARQRWLEEVEAWEFALGCFAEFELRGVEVARRRGRKSLRRRFWTTCRRAKPETVERIVARYPRWVWEET